MSQVISTAKISCVAADCNSKISQKDYLRRHVKDHNQRPQFNCEFCGKLMITKRGWETHLKRHTGELLPCTVCDFKTAYVARLKAHIKMHELGNKGIDWPKAPNTHKCQLCDYVAPSEGRVMQHARIHFDELPYACSIPGCGHRTKWKGNLKQHEDRHDAIKSTKFSCPMCPKRFCTEYQVTRHVRTHTQERPRECPDCDYRAASLVQVKRHQQRHHFSNEKHSTREDKEEHEGNQSEEVTAPEETKYSLRDGLRPVKISLELNERLASFEKSEAGNDTEGQRSSSVSCDRITLDSSPLETVDDDKKVKRKTKTAKKQRIYPKNHVCSICAYATPRSAYLKDHMRIHLDDKPFHCQAPNCNFQTKWATSLGEHTKRLHAPKKYSCPLEGCDFQSQDSILSRKHRRLHKLPFKKTLQCPLCPKMYASKFGLDAHVLSHTGEKAFKCERCDYKSKTSSKVTRHFSRMHSQ